MKRVDLSPEALRWLDENHNRQTLTATAAHLGIDLDTLRRILHRRGLRIFNGAKYQRRDDALPSNRWTRPCSRCGCTKPRAKWQFRCRKCHDMERHLA